MSLQTNVHFFREASPFGQYPLYLRSPDGSPVEQNEATKKASEIVLLVQKAFDLVRTSDETERTKPLSCVVGRNILDGSVKTSLGEGSLGCVAALFQTYTRLWDKKDALDGEIYITEGLALVERCKTTGDYVYTIITKA